MSARVVAFTETLESLSTACRGASRTFRVWVGLAETVEERAYKAAHGGRAPGSKGTARLRKKRRDAVRRWAESVGYNGTKLVTATRARGNLHLGGGRSRTLYNGESVRFVSHNSGWGEVTP